MAVLTDLIARVRLELDDQANSFTKTFTGDGTTRLFALGYTPIDTTYLTVTVNGTPILQPAGYTADANHGTVLFAVAPANLAAIVVVGTYYRFFTDTDLTTFINTALLQHTENRTDQYGSIVSIASLPGVEDYPLIIMAVVEALWVLATDASFDTDITAPDGIHIPRSQRFSQMNVMIQSRLDQYKQLCSALNIGIWRVEMGTLRRVSRTTNKLVPV